MYIGIDLGTSAVKILLINKSGKIIRSISKEYPILFPKENWFEQNPEEWIEKSFEGLKEISKGYEDDIKAISFSGQMHGSVFLDENNNVIRPAILWCDQRTIIECEEINKKFKNRLIDLTGNIALTGFTAPKILWLKKNEPENFKKIKKIMLPKDYLVYRLSGVFSTDYSDASGTLLLNVKNKIWSSEILDFLEINKEQLPVLYESYDIVGIISRKIASSLNLNKNIKIVAGGGDQAVGAVGVGAVEEGIISVALGTSGVVFASISEYFVDKNSRLHSFCHSNGKYHQMGVMLSAAGSLKWWIENINCSKDYSFLIEQEAKNSIFDENLFFLPYLTGERTPHNDPHARGTFIGLNIQHNRGDLTRTIIEGVSFALRDSLEILRDMNIQTKVIRISGGGAKSDFWKQVIADIFNLEIETINTTDGPAYGAAILATIGDGLFSSVSIACKNFIRVIDSKTPNLEKNSFYEKKYEKFKKIYPIIKKINEL